MKYSKLRTYIHILLTNKLFSPPVAVTIGLEAAIGACAEVAAVGCLGGEGTGDEGEEGDEAEGVLNSRQVSVMRTE